MKKPLPIDKPEGYSFSALFTVIQGFLSNTRHSNEIAGWDHHTRAFFTAACKLDSGLRDFMIEFAPDDFKAILESTELVDIAKSKSPRGK